MGRAAPLTRIAELMAGLFSSADLTPTDIVTALVKRARPLPFLIPATLLSNSNCRWIICWFPLMHTGKAHTGKACPCTPGG